MTGQSIWCDEEETSSDTDAASPENKQQNQAAQQPSSPDKKTSVDEKAELKNTSLTVSDYDSDLPQYKSGRKFRKLPLTEMTESENGIELNGLNPMNSINGTTMSYSAKSSKNLNSNSILTSSSSSHSNLNSNLNLNLNSNYSNNDTDSPVYEASDSLFRPEENESGNGIEIDRMIAQKNAKIDRDILIYSICIFINAIIVEGPTAVIEGTVRALLCILISIILLISAVICRNQSLLSLSLQFIREAILSFFAALTLCFPGSSCFAYRWYCLDGKWKLAPIPTLFGWVDTRRFVAFTFGNGCFACNVRHDNYLYDSHERDLDDIQYHTTHPQRDQIEDLGPCYDSWPGIILLEPRKIQANIIRIVRGEDRLSILERVLPNEDYTAVHIGDDDQGVRL